MRAAVVTGGEVRVEERPEPSSSGDLVEDKELIAPMCTEYLVRRPSDTTYALGRTPGPAAQTRGHWHGGRVFDTSLGHPNDFNPMRWAMASRAR
jgi:hypothetical protein